MRSRARRRKKRAGRCTGRTSDWRLLTRRYWLFQVPFRFRGRRRFRRTFVETVGRINLPVQEWVVDDADDMRSLIDWGANGIISDRPDLAMTIVKLEGGPVQSRVMRF